MDRDFWRILLFLFFLFFTFLALIILSLGILTKNMLDIVIVVIFASGIFAFLYTVIYDIFADIYDEIDELKLEIERLKRKT
jgi:hypothetical protein